MLKFKKSLLIVVLAVVALVGTACKQRTFKADGVYTAFSTEYTNQSGPQITIAEVTIEKDAIVGINIDTIQSYPTEGRGGAPAWAFNAKSKKELGYEYGMHNPFGEGRFDLSTDEGMNAYKEYLEENELLEWFEQAALIETHLLENGLNSVTVDEDGYVDNVTNVTIVDNYSKVAQEAVELAKKGIARAVAINGSDVVWAEAEVNKKGEFTKLVLDTLQGDTNAEGKFTWHEKSKQEKQYLYGMHNPRNDSFDLTTDAGMAEYKSYLQENELLEWFEQANLITKYVLENGLDKLTVDEAGGVTTDALSQVTIVASHYHAALSKLFNNFA